MSLFIKPLQNSMHFELQSNELEIVISSLEFLATKP